MYTVFTTFKNKSATFFSFQNFYRKYWNVKQFCYLVGYINIENKNYILNDYFKDEKFETRNFKINLNDLVNDMYGYYNEKYYLILYKTKGKININEWNIIKNSLQNIIRTQFYKHFNIKKLIYVDDDEFIYTKNTNEISDKKRFHFIEFIPNDVFDKENMEWSTQAWSHCHCLYAENNHPEKTYKCSGCKRYGFNKYNNWEEYMRHGGDNLSDSIECQNFMSIQDKSSLTDQNLIDLFQNNVCFHVIGLNRKKLKEIKQVNRFDISQQGNWRNDLFQETNELIKKNIKCFKWNFLADIIDEKDLL